MSQAGFKLLFVGQQDEHLTVDNLGDFAFVEGLG
jgi:hypothetical protein